MSDVSPSCSGKFFKTRPFLHLWQTHRWSGNLNPKMLTDIFSQVLKLIQATGREEGCRDPKNNARPNEPFLQTQRPSLAIKPGCHFHRFLASLSSYFIQELCETVRDLAWSTFRASVSASWQHSKAEDRTQSMFRSCWGLKSDEILQVRLAWCLRTV